MVFGIRESSSFARALAASESIKVSQVRENITPYSKKDGSIVVGTPSLYHHKEYMGNLHREISKQTKGMSFFHDVDVEDNEFQHLAKGILQAQRTEYHMEGEYQGRDRILREQYTRNMKDAGGIQKVVERVAKDNKSAAAMLYIGNELRNDWQSYHHVDMPPEIEDEVNRLRPMLEEKWLSLDSKESLETLLQRIQYEEQEEEHKEEQGEGDDGDSEGDGQEGDGRSGDGQGGSGEQAGDSQEGVENGEGGGSSGDGEDESGEDEGDSGRTTQESSESGEDNQGDEEGEHDSEGDDRDSPEGQDGPEDGDIPGEEEGESSEDPSGTTEGQDSEDDGDNGKDVPTIAHNHHGAGGASTSLKDIGLIKEPVQDHESPPANKVPYNPGSNVQDIDCTHNEHEPTRYTETIAEHLESFRLSKKIRKYLISMSQTGYQYGMKRGKICPKNISRVYAGHQQPRIFKQKLATKIQQDTAIFLLGDCSGSMSNARYSISGSCQIAISEVLQSLHIAHMMMQFTSSGSTRKHYIMKEFKERYVSRDKLIQRYGSSTIRMGCNADGEAVTDAAQRLAKRDEKNKILIVLSDGEPAFGYGNDIKFLKDTVKEIESSNVMDIIGIGIQTNSVQHFYKDSKVVHRLDELESVLLNLLKDRILC